MKPGGSRASWGGVGWSSSGSSMGWLWAPIPLGLKIAVLADGLDCLVEFVRQENTAWTQNSGP
jgi:hypothetical protein